MFKGFIFDLDGTVYLSDKLIPGAERVIRLLRDLSLNLTLNLIVLQPIFK